MRTRIAIGLFCSALVAACGGGESSPSPDGPAPDTEPFESNCGFPGDEGNELGIGKFCASLGDCASTTAAPLCSSLGDDTTHFCTKRCDMGSTDMCGTDAECTCNGSNQCGCTPTVCLE
jgi:hypothetical protein